MAYNPYYAPYYRPMNYYNPSIPQEQNTQMPVQQQIPVQQIPMVQPTQPNDMIWVLSEVEAQSYPVAANNSVILWDKNNDVVYIKSVNMQGVPSMRILDYKERTAENANKGADKHECQCGNKFVSIDKFEALQGEFKALRGELEELKTKPKAKTVKRVIEEEEDDE
jgi:hypothetical protein